MIIRHLLFQKLAMGVMECRKWLLGLHEACRYAAYSTCVVTTTAKLHLTYMAVKRIAHCTVRTIK